MSAMTAMEIIATAHSPQLCCYRSSLLSGLCGKLPLGRYHRGCFELFRPCRIKQLSQPSRNLGPFFIVPLGRATTCSHRCEQFPQDHRWVPQLSPASKRAEPTALAGLSFEKGVSRNYRCNPVLISRRQQLVVPAITYQRRIVQGGRGGNTMAVSCLYDCVVRVAGALVESRRRHLFIPTQKVASGVCLRMQ